jgi:hypothetical protein
MNIQNRVHAYQTLAPLQGDGNIKKLCDSKRFINGTTHAVLFLGVCRCVQGDIYSSTDSLCICSPIIALLNQYTERVLRISSI